MDKERLDFHTALVNKIKEWEGTEDFSAGSTNRQKLNRSLNLLLGTNPDVLVDFFDINTVPDDPREAMNLIRGADLKTLKDMEIFQIKGLGKKLVLHHEIAANTLGVHLANMSPSERLDVYKGMIDLGQKHGMDPRQLILIPDSIHKSIAHEGDFTGKKTGALLPPIIGESGSDFLKRFKSSIDVQLNAARKAVNMPVTQDWYQVINKVEESLNIPKGTLVGYETPLELKASASKFLQPSAEGMRQVVEAGGDLTKGAGEVIKETVFSRKKFEELDFIAQSKGFARLNPELFNLRAVDPFSGAVAGAVEAAKTVRANPLGAAAGVLGGLDTESVKLAREGQYEQAALRTAGGAALGALGEVAVKRVAPMAMKLIPQAGKMVMGAVGAPVAAGMAGYQALDLITTAATGKTLAETGQAAEQTKEELRQQGMSEYQLRRRARTGR